MVNVQITAGESKPGVTIKYKDENGNVQTIQKDVQVLVNGKPAKPVKVSEAGLAMMTKPLMRSPLPGGVESQKVKPAGVPQAKPMTTWQKAKSFGKFLVNAATGKAGLNKKAEAERRFSLCQVCEHFEPKREMCKLCTCKMRYKTWVNDETAHCPIGKF